MEMTEDTWEGIPRDEQALEAMDVWNYEGKRLDGSVALRTAEPNF